MPDFSTLLSAPAGKAVKPKALPIGEYPGVIKSWTAEEVTSRRDQVKSTVIRYQLALRDWPEGVSDGDKSQPDGDGNELPIDLSKRPLRRDFYYANADGTPHSARVYLDDFLKSIGIDLEGRSYGEVLPEAVGAFVMVEVQQYLNQQTNEFGNQVGGLRGE